MSFRSDVILCCVAPIPAAPATRGANISWLRKVRAGDNQRQSPACTCFTLANWLEIMDGISISDDEAVAVWRTGIEMCGLNKESGLAVPWAFAAAQERKWFNDSATIFRATDLARTMATQPVIAVYEITKGWYNPDPKTGCLDHSPEANAEREGYHCVLATSLMYDLGGTPIPDGPWVSIEQSWGFGHGYQGQVSMNAKMHTRQCKELWEIRR